MNNNDTAPILAQLIKYYLCARGSNNMTEVDPSYVGVDYEVLVQYHDILGWQNFIEGHFL